MGVNFLHRYIFGGGIFIWYHFQVVLNKVCPNFDPLRCRVAGSQQGVNFFLYDYIGKNKDNLY